MVKLADDAPGYLRLPDPGDPKALYIFDLHCWLHRYYATMKGRAAHGFVGLLSRVIRMRDPKHIVVCADPSGRNTWRDQLSPGVYKAHRPPTDDALKTRIRWASEMATDVFGVRVYKHRQFEADDLIASITHAARRDGLRVVIVGLDKDLMQLVDSRCVMWDGKAGVVGPVEASAKFHGLKPFQIADFLAIVGDKADNIQGIPGLGPKAATNLLEEFGFLEEAVKVAVSPYTHPFFRRNENYRALIRQHQKTIELSQALTALRTDAVEYRREDLLRLKG